MPGPRKCKDLVKNGIGRWVELHEKTLFSRLTMAGERPVGEAELGWFIDGVNYLCGMKAEEAEMPREDPNGNSGFNGSIRPAEFDPRQIEHLPIANCVERLFKFVITGSDPYTIVIDNVARWGSHGGRADLAI
jgi:hypothetical protein